MLTSSIIPVIFVGLNQTKLLWKCEGYPECDSIGFDTVYIPPNPLGDNKYIIIVLASIHDDFLYWRGNITFTHQETAETYFFEYLLGGSSTYWGDIDQEVWIMPSGSYLISWENSDDTFVDIKSFEYYRTSKKFWDKDCYEKLVLGLGKHVFIFDVKACEFLKKINK